MLNKMDNQRVNNAKSGPVLYLVRDQACPGGHSIIYLHQWQSLTHHHHHQEKDQNKEHHDGDRDGSRAKCQAGIGSICSWG